MNLKKNWVDLALVSVVAGFTSLVVINTIFGDKSYRAGQILGSDNVNPSVDYKNANFSPNRSFPGYVNFDYKGRTFYDFEFDGDCDFIRFSRADERGKYRDVELKPGDAEFQEHLPLYFEARDIATRGRLE